MDQITQDMRDLIWWLNRYTEAYSKGHPLITDEKWDEIYFRLQKMEQETGIVYPDSPTQSITYSIVDKLNTVKHNHPMLSLNKTKDIETIKSFVGGHEWCMMFKMDGLTCSLTYEDGVLVGAETRGNGIEGEDILHNVRVMSSIPQNIPEKGTVIIDGEVICKLADFEEFSKDYKNPRNFAAGSIRLLDSKESASRYLTFVAWDLIKGCDDIDFFFRRLEKLDDWGFETVPRIGDAETVEDAIEIFSKYMSTEAERIYPIDGFVFRFQSQKYYNSLGATAHHFNGAMAYKFYDEEYETELLDIEWSMGRTGVLTPVAIFEPIEIDGSEVSRASLHNYSVMQDILGTYPEKNQKIWVIKANQIIPQISRAVENECLHDHVLSNCPPLVCPICGESLDIQKSDTGVLNVVCNNKQCEGQLLYKLDHFCGKKGLDIKGLSEKTLEKLIDWGWINGPGDIFRLDAHRAEWLAKEGFGAASVGKILGAIGDTASGVELDAFISALGIPLVGRTIAKEIVKYYDTWEDFRNAVGGDWTEFEGFGPEISRSINNFDYTEADEVAGLVLFKQHEEQPKEAAAAIEGKTFCITGKVVQYKNRDELKTEIESLGGKVVSSISSKVNYLITNDPNSGTEKNRKAQGLNIPIITEEEYIAMKGE